MFPLKRNTFEAKTYSFGRFTFEILALNLIPSEKRCYVNVGKCKWVEICNKASSTTNAMHFCLNYFFSFGIRTN